MVYSATKSSQDPVSLDHALEQISASFSDQVLPNSLSFDFQWNNLQWHLDTKAQNDGSFSLLLQARLGVIPFTAEDVYRRQTALATIINWPTKESNRLSVDRNGMVTLSLKSLFDDGNHINTLITTAVFILIGMKDPVADLAGNLISIPSKNTGQKAA